MNQVFNFHRFGLLLKLDFAENGKKNTLSFLVIAGVMLILMNPYIDFSKIHIDATFLHVLALSIAMFCGSLFTSLAFSKYNNPSECISAISVPASQTEKFLSALFTNMIFMSLLLILFFVLHFEGVKIILSRFPDETFIKKLPPSISMFLIFLFFFVHGVSFLGSIYFRKAGFVKTAGIFFALIIAVYLLNIFMVDQLSGHEKNIGSTPFLSWFVPRNGRLIKLESGESIYSALKVLMIMAVLGLWYITYIRLTEKEI